MALQKMLGQKKVFQIQPKSTQGTQGEHNKALFNQKLPLGSLPQVSRRLLGKI
jgi:hypothetical protein